MHDHHSVEVIAEGTRASLEELIRYLHSGPRMARVDRVDIQWLAPSGDFATSARGSEPGPM
jgi:acylphosphatase